MRDLQGLKGNILLIPQLCNLTGLGTMRQVSALAVAPRFDLFVVFDLVNCDMIMPIFDRVIGQCADS